MRKKNDPHQPINRMSKDERSNRVAREILLEEKRKREEKIERLKTARLNRDSETDVK